MMTIRIWFKLLYAHILSNFKVYLLKCGQWSAQYIGEISRDIITRVCDHEGISSLNHPDSAHLMSPVSLRSDKNDR